MDRRGVIFSAVLVLLVFSMPFVFSANVQTRLTVLDINPSVTNLTINPNLASPGENITISANVSAYRGISAVYGRVKQSNNVFTNHAMSNITFDMYNFTYHVISSLPSGIYFVTIIANTTFNAVNDSTSGNFTVNISQFAVQEAAVAAAVPSRGGAPSGIISYTQGWCDVQANQRLTMNINKDGLVFSQIRFTVTNDIAGCARITVSSSNGVLGIEGVVYKFVNVQEYGFANHLNEIVVNFKVSKEWLKDNNIDEVYLYRHGSEWRSNKAVLVSSDSEYNYYSSTVPGLGMFAIAGSQVVVQGKQPLPETPAETTMIPFVPKEYSAYVVVGAILAILFLSLLIVYLVRRKHVEQF